MTEKNVVPSSHLMADNSADPLESVEGLKDIAKKFTSLSSLSLTTGGYGTDPNLITPAVPWPRTLTDHQRSLSAALSDIILPAREEFPAPSEMGIVDFLDEWVSAPYPQQRTDRELLSSGLALIDSESQRRFGKGFVELTDDQKRAIVEGIASEPGTSLVRSFFKRFRYLVVGGYFTSDIGLKAIGYFGNVPMQSFPGVSNEVQSIIDHELKKLGL